MAKKNENQLVKNIDEKTLRRESTKNFIFGISCLVRRNRKNFLTDRDIKPTIFSKDQAELFYKLINKESYLQFPTQVADVIAEGIKYPETKLRRYCQNLWEDDLERGNVDLYLTVKILNADYVPKKAFEFFEKYADLFQLPSIQKMIVNAQKQKSKKSFDNSLEWKNREMYKTLLENLWRDLRTNRKQYLFNPDAGANNINFGNLKHLLIEQNYEKYPIQIADILSEGVKFPENHVKDFCQKFWGESLKKGNMDIYLWVKILSAEFVPNQAWRFLAEYADQLQEAKELLRTLIVRKAATGRNTGVGHEEIDNLFIENLKKFS